MVMVKQVKKSVKKQKSVSEQISSARAARLFLAGYLLVLLLSQLFTFDELPGVLEAVGIEGVFGYIVPGVLVLSGLFSLPYLIDLKIGSGLKKISLVAGFVYLFNMTAVEILAFLGQQSVIFGATFDLPGGAWSLIFLSALWVLALWGALGQDKLTKSKSR